MTVRDPSQPPATRVALVTGPAGAGRTTALDALEDLGFETIDNMPLSLVPHLLDGHGGSALALGVDARTRDFGLAALGELLARLRREPSLGTFLVCIDADDAALSRRFAETRRRHPLAASGPPEEGIARDRAALAPVAALADILIDSSHMAPGDLRAEIRRHFAADTPAASVTIMSFAYKRGLPRGADLVFDCRLLSNPHWDPALRPLDGRAAQVAAHIAADPRFAPFMDQLVGMCRSMIRAMNEDGRAHLSIATGCTGGRHRSVAVAEKLAHTLEQDGRLVSKRHRELDDRRSAANTGSGD